MSQPENPRFDAVLARAEQTAISKHEHEQLVSLAQLFLKAAHGDRGQARRLLAELPALFCDENGVFQIWRYRVVLNSIVGGR